VSLSGLTPADAEAIGRPVRSFIEECVIPLEREAFAARIDDKLRIHLQHGANQWRA
jgi:hypothetical protein